MSGSDLQPTPDCCAAWSSLIGTFGWFSAEAYPEVLVMPCLVVGEQRIRVNHCPSCGAPCRMAVVALARVEAARADQ